MTAHDPSSDLDDLLNPILGEAVGALEAKGLRPKAMLFSILLEGNDAHQVGIEKASPDETGNFNEVMGMLVEIAVHVQKKPEIGEQVMKALDEILVKEKK